MREALAILCVDDVISLRRMIALTLAAEGHHVLEASDGAEALRLLDGGAAVDLVLTALTMSGMDGLSLLRALRASPHLPDIPVIVLPAEGDVTGRVEAMAAGAVAWIAKPVQFAVLRDVIERVRRS